MKTFVLTCSLFAALALPVFAQARDVTFTTELQVRRRWSLSGAVSYRCRRRVSGYPLGFREEI